MEKDKLFDCRNSSSIFYKIMKRYHQRNNNPILSNKGYIAYAIEQKRQKLQLEEKDDMYIYKEAKNIANTNELLLNLYGNKAKKRFYDISKLMNPIKLDRKLFFVPGKKEEKSSENKKNKAVNYINKNGYMKLPLIDKNIIYRKTKESKSTKNFFTVGNVKNIDNREKSITKIENKNNKNDKKVKILNNEKEKQILGIDALKMKINKSHKNIKINQEKNISSKSKIISKSNKNIFLTNKTNKTKIEEVKEYKNKEKITSKEKNINKDNNNKKAKNELTLTENYISKLTDFKEQLIKEEQHNRKYFNTNDYGCRNFKEKYNYLNRKYFN